MACLQLVVDDKSLEDAELWELIDSAASRHAHFKPNHQQPQQQQHHHLSPPRKPLLITHPSLKVTEIPPSPQLANDGIDSRRASKIQKRQPQYTIRTVDTPPAEAKQRPWIHPPKFTRHDDQNRMAELYQCNGGNMQRSNHPGRFPLHDNGAHASVFASSHELVERPNTNNVWAEAKESRIFSGIGAVESEWMGGMPSATMFKHFQTAAMAVLEKGDYALMQGKPFIKKSGWRKIAFFFNISFEIKDKTIEFDQNNNVLRAEFVVRASMQSGRFTDSWGSCDRGEKRFSKPNHEIPSTAETRAKTRACQDLLGIGEYKVGNSGW